MTSTARVDISAGPRAVVGTTAEVLFRVGQSLLGASRMPTARGNAWAAVLADRERARIRAELEHMLSR
jgi:hypothetical protein